MLDIKYVRENQEAVAEAMKNRHASWDAARFSQLDEARRAAITQEEALQAERNAASKAIGQMLSLIHICIKRHASLLAASAHRRMAVR